jgi:aminoglycoside phosphotransferase (APT) family kinase protein
VNSRQEFRPKCVPELSRKMAIGTPSAEFSIDESMVRELLLAQHPDLADSTLIPLDAGWDNVMFRLGEELVVRLPRRREAVALIEHEQAWLPTLASQLPISVPTPARVGEASSTYPWPWSILPWLPGRSADLEAPATDQTRALAEFLHALHQPAPPDAPLNPVRGVSLSERSTAVGERLGRLRRVTQVVTPALLGVWNEALDAPKATESNWLHGDLHARNVLVEEGRITGVIDWGDITAGDAATDLASVWMLFDDVRARADCLARYQPSDALLARARGWAVSFGAVLLDTGLVDHPRHAAMGEAILRRLVEDA